MTRPGSLKKESGRTVILNTANILFSEESGISLELKDGLKE